MPRPEFVWPDWPRGLSLELGARYVGLSPSAFLAAVGAGNIPPAIWITTRRKVWLREDLDAWLDAKAGRAPCSIRNPWDDLLDTANPLDDLLRRREQQATVDQSRARRQRR